MDIQKWLNDQNIEAVQDRIDGKDYWMYNNLYTEIDLIELLEAFSLHVVSNTEGKLQAVDDLIEFARNNCREWNNDEMEEIIDRL